MNRGISVTVVGAATALFVLGAAVLTFARGPSTPQERDEAVRLARYLEENPLAEDAPSIRNSLLGFYHEAPDIVLRVCYFLGPLQEKSHPFFMDLIRQTAISSGAFIILNPERAKDDVAVYTAGLEGALRAYERFVKAKPEGRLEFVDGLLQKRSLGELESYVREQTPKNCKE